MLRGLAHLHPPGTFPAAGKKARAELATQAQVALELAKPAGQTPGIGERRPQVVEATLTADGDHTILILDQRGMPVNLLAAYGAGNQVHIEDLAAHIAGQERCDAEARWEELQPSYEGLTSKLD